MPVQAVETQLRCKLCASPHREAIDALLEQRSKRQDDADGKRVNTDYVIERLKALGVKNPNADNLKNHWAKHSRIISDADVQAGKQAQDEILARPAGTVDEVLDRITELGVRDLEMRLLAAKESGDLVGVTVDQLLKTQDIRNKRRKDEAAADLMRMQGAAIGAALADGWKPMEALPEADLELEVVDEDFDPGEPIETHPDGSVRWA